MPQAFHIRALQDEAECFTSLPLYAERIQAGFPSPAEDYIESYLDLNEYVVKKPVATFFLRVQGDSMRGAGIFNGDLLVVDRSIEPKNQHIVVAQLNGEFTLKRLIRNSSGLYLYPENPHYSPTRITEEMDFTVWGVATHVVHHLK